MANPVAVAARSQKARNPKMLVAPVLAPRQMAKAPKPPRQKAPKGRLISTGAAFLRGIRETLGFLIERVSRDRGFRLNWRYLLGPRLQRGPRFRIDLSSHE